VFAGSGVNASNDGTLIKISLESLGKLPLSIWISIMSFCEHKSIIRLSQVCFAFYFPALKDMGGHVVTLAAINPTFFYFPAGMCFSESDECLYVSDFGRHMIKKFDLKTGELTTVAGDATGKSGFKDGPGATAKFFHPIDVTWEGNHRSLLVADWGNHKIRRIKLPNRVGRGAHVETIAGCGAQGSKDGPALESQFYNPYSLCVDPSNNACYIADYRNHKIRKLASI